MKKSDSNVKEEKSEIFESKFVKQIIETFNNVLEVVDEQEKELNEYLGSEVTQPKKKQKIKQTKPPA